ncbi:phage protein [Haemophilus parahaemolyticus]|uniref:phage protein n=1 Tax=Haemophilus parahaemolyticus TaxID=735 RepID=UPI003CD0CAFD
MMRQFGRQFQLDIIGKSDTLVINNLRISFDIDKTINEKPNPATIRVWNLNRSHLNQILSGAFDKVALSVGYQTLTQIYSGDITKAHVQRHDLDFILTLECADGFRAYTQARITSTLKSGSNDDQILTELSKTLPNVSLGTVEVTNKRKLPRGKVMNGDTRELLNRLARNSGADWSIQDGELVFLPKNKVLKAEAILISQETGMVNAPEHTDDGLELQCLLNPQLAIGGLVEVKSILDYFNGEYKVVKLLHSGDAMEGDWLSKMTVVGGQFQPVEKNKSEKKDKTTSKK